MQCVHCGADLEPNQTICPHCQQDPRITVLPPEEREYFNGLTIEQETGNEYHESPDRSGRRHVYVRHINLSSHGNFVVKLIIGLIFLLFIIVALPLAVLLAACFGVYWFFLKKILK